MNSIMFIYLKTSSSLTLITTDNIIAARPCKSICLFLLMMPRIFVGNDFSGPSTVLEAANYPPEKLLVCDDVRFRFVYLKLSKMYGHRQLVVTIPRLSATSCHLLGKINAAGTFFSTRHLWFPSWAAILTINTDVSKRRMFPLHCQVDGRMVLRVESAPAVYGTGKTKDSICRILCMEHNTVHRYLWVLTKMGVHQWWNMFRTLSGLHFRHPNLSVRKLRTSQQENATELR